MPGVPRTRLKDLRDPVGVPTAFCTTRLVHPVLAKLFHREGWVYEEKYDGWRAVAIRTGATGVS